MNLPQMQKIMREFERESAAMDMKDEMMGDAVDEAMDDDAEGVGEEEEGDAILKEVLDEIGVGLGQQVGKGRCQCQSYAHLPFSVLPGQLGEAPVGTLGAPAAAPAERVAIGEGLGGAGGSGSGGDAGKSDEDALQARLDSLRKD